jgi:hypothetical protein
MIYELRLPLIIPQMTGATVECLYASEGDALKLGSKFIDLSIDLGSAFAQECPPISYYRLILREAAVLREFTAQPGQYFELNAPIALLSTTADEPVDTTPNRLVRITTAGIIHHEGMWTGNIR